MALAHAILVSLLDRPSSGYDLVKRFDGIASKSFSPLRIFNDSLISLISFTEIVE